jgi:hypothetical protein
VIYVSGKCERCHKYYELPGQQDEADAFIAIGDAQTATFRILCVNAILCAERAAGG